jgi:hypothetical protein
MSYNGSGTFQINTSGQPVVTGTVISSSAFNALTADLATGLSTAITKDGQTATTVRIPFAQGINSSLATDSTSGSTGSIFTAGGVGITKSLFVGGTATFSASPIFSALTASSAVATDASKNLVSVTNTGTGNNVLATSPTLVTPALGTPASGVVTNLTGTASININGTVGATTASTGAFTTLSATGVTTVQAGTAALPAITTTGDTNTGIFFPAADTIAFTEGGTESMRITFSGDVGIGTSSPNAKLEIKAATASQRQLQLTHFNSTDGWYFTADDTGGVLKTSRAGSSDLNGEAMRIDSSGAVFVGGTGPIVYSKLLSQFDGASNYGIVANDTSNGNNVGFMAFAINGNSTSGSIGTILRNGTANSVLYNTTSDQRLKENITEADAALGIVEKIKVRKYDWIEGKQHEDHGFIAQELAEAVNGVVSKGKTEDDMWAVDYGKLTPLLCKAIQEQQALITSLTARIAALEAK